MTSEVLSSLQAYHDWTNYPGSSLLLLSGKTDIKSRTGRGYTHSWLSPAALHVATTLPSNEPRKVAFYSCHPGVRIDDLEVPTHLGKDMLTRLSYQLLEQQPSILCRKMQQLQTLLQDPAWNGVEGGANGFGGGREERERRDKEKASLRRHTTI